MSSRADRRRGEREKEGGCGEAGEQAEAIEKNSAEIEINLILVNYTPKGTDFVNNFQHASPLCGAEAQALSGRNEPGFWRSRVTAASQPDGLANLPEIGKNFLTSYAGV